MAQHNNAELLLLLQDQGRTSQMEGASNFCSIHLLIACCQLSKRRLWPVPKHGCVSVCDYTELTCVSKILDFPYQGKRMDKVRNRCGLLCMGPSVRTPLPPLFSPLQPWDALLPSTAPNSPHPLLP